MSESEPTTPTHGLGRSEIIAMVAAMIAINATAIDIMLPGMQVIGAALGEADENRRQLVVTAYLLGFGTLQLLFGPLSDRLGRRRPLLLGLAVYAAAALAAILVERFAMLLALRFLQGAGAAASVVVAIAFVRDLFGGRQMAEVMSLVMMVFMITPVVAPIAGQLIMLSGEWRLVFMFMAAVGGLVGLWVGTRMPETLPPERRRPFTLGVIIAGFALVAGQRTSACYILATASILGALFAFIGSSPQIYAGLYGMGVWFPLAFAAVASAMALGSFANSRLVRRLGMRRMGHSALLGFLALSLVLTGLAARGPVPLWLYLPLFAATMLCFAGIGSNFGAIAMEPLGHVAGTAASAQGFTQMILGASLGAAIGQRFDGTVLPLVSGFALLAAVALALVLFAERGRLFGSATAAPGARP